MPATLENLESALANTETFVRWVALLAATFTALAAVGGVRLWLLQRAARPLRESAKRASEERISALHAQVAEANARAADANEAAALASDRAATVNVRAEETEKKAAELALASEEMRRKNLENERKLEAERATRVELEKSLAPRSLVYTAYTGHDAPTDVVPIGPLKQHAGTKAFVSHAPDAEAAGAAFILASLLRDVGWVVSDVRPSDRTMPGVQVHQSRDGARPADEIVKLLRANGWQEVRSIGASRIPDTIEIAIGSKPSPYFDPPTIKRAKEEMDRRLKENAEYWKSSPLEGDKE